MENDHEDIFFLFIYFRISDGIRVIFLMVISILLFFMDKLTIVLVNNPKFKQIFLHISAKTQTALLIKVGQK